MNSFFSLAEALQRDGELVFEVRIRPIQAPRHNVPTTTVGEAVPIDNDSIRKSIISYVHRLYPAYVAPLWQNKYGCLWQIILDGELVSNAIYAVGKQKETTFNRNLVGNIIHLLANEKVLTTTNASRLACVLEGSSQHSIRIKLGENPPKLLLKEVLKSIEDVSSTT